MNYLAHIFLSGESKEIMIGNFIADFIKGKSFHQVYNEKISRGIVLHRLIDTYTDQDEQLALSRKPLHPHFHKYSGAVMDIYLDHFLAENWPRYSKISLSQFADEFYENARPYSEKMPQMARHLLEVMKLQDWFGNYSHMEGMSLTFNRFSRRINYPPIENAGIYLKENKIQIGKVFEEFFPRLMNEVELFLNQENKGDSIQ